METNGTCAWCFGEYAATASNITTRHGWREVSGMLKAGGRRQGEYGNVFHSGECDGVRFPPYELSDAGTKARLEYERSGAAACAKESARLVTERPEVLVLGFVRLYGRFDGRYPYAVMLKSGDDFRVTVDDQGFGGDHFSYEKWLKNKLAELEFFRVEHERAAAMCETKIAEWKLSELRPRAPKAATVHFKREGARRPFCGSKSYGLETADIETGATCTRCLKAIAKHQAYVAAKAADDELLKRALEWMKAQSEPATARAVADALGADRKMVNRVLSNSSGVVNRTFDSPTKYSPRA